MRLVAKGPAALLVSVVFGVLGACSTFGSGTEPDAQQSSDAGSASDATADTSASLDSAGVDPGGEDAALDALDAGAGCGSRIACQRTVFVTKDTHNGKLGTVTGADKICQDAADFTDHQAVTGRRYIAWLSGVPANGNVVSTPEDRIAAHGEAPYVLPTGVIVAADWEAFASGQHQHAIDVDEFGTQASVISSHAWTGTANDGTPLGGDCTGWTTATDAGALGHQGSITANNAMWSDEQERPCFTEARLYCVEK